MISSPSPDAQRRHRDQKSARPRVHGYRVLCSHHLGKGVFEVGDARPLDPPTGADHVDDRFDFLFADPRTGEGDAHPSRPLDIGPGTGVDERLWWVGHRSTRASMNLMSCLTSCLVRAGAPALQPPYSPVECRE